MTIMTRVRRGVGTQKKKLFGQTKDRWGKINGTQNKRVGMGNYAIIYICCPSISMMTT